MSFPIQNAGSFHSLNVYQAGYMAPSAPIPHPHLLQSQAGKQPPGALSDDLPGPLRGTQLALPRAAGPIGPLR